MYFFFAGWHRKLPLVCFVNQNIRHKIRYLQIHIILKWKSFSFSSLRFPQKRLPKNYFEFISHFQMDKHRNEVKLFLFLLIRPQNIQISRFVMALIFFFENQSVFYTLSLSLTLYVCVCPVQILTTHFKLYTKKFKFTKFLIIITKDAITKSFECEYLRMNRNAIELSHSNLSTHFDSFCWWSLLEMQKTFLIRRVIDFEFIVREFVISTSRVIFLSFFIRKVMVLIDFRPLFTLISGSIQKQNQYKMHKTQWISYFTTQQKGKSNPIL